jgi:hypothetical protein
MMIENSLNDLTELFHGNFWLEPQMEVAIGLASPPNPPVSATSGA